MQRFVDAYTQAFAESSRIQKKPPTHVKENPEYAQKKDVLIAQIDADMKHTFFSGDTRRTASVG